MDSPFPLGLPPSTAFYLALYLATWSLHWAFMHYVAAGTLWIVWGTIDDAFFEGSFWRAPVTRTALSWLPFMLSAAITAGVAPLLFVQILFGVPFYTGTLLLFWIWLLIIPALIALFYLLYLLQAWRDREGFAGVRIGIAVAGLGCVVIVGGLWITNHLIANAGLSEWTALYAHERSPFDWPQILARGAISIGLAFSGMAMIAGWQVWRGIDSSAAGSASGEASAAVPETLGATGCASADAGALNSEPRWLGMAALAGFALACTGGSILFTLLPQDARGAIVGPFAFSYLIALATGIVIQIMAWSWLTVTGRWHWLGLAAATFGYVNSLLALSVVRESIRLAALGYEAFRDAHERAAALEGWPTFLLFTAMNVGLIAFCVWLVWRGGVREGGVSPPQE